MVIFARNFGVSHRVKKLFKHIVILMFLPVFGWAQLAELGLYGGTSNFVGDVGYGFIPKGYSAGLVYRYQFDERYGLRVQGTYGKISAQDSDSPAKYKTNRNLEFESSIFEGALMIEFNFFKYITGSKKYWHTPYIFGGLAFFNFNPQASFEGELYELQPLGTEGQGTSLSNNAPYGLWGLNIPFGLGYRVSVSENVSFSAEVGFRSTSTDYLDDASGSYVDAQRLANENGDIAGYFSDRSLTDTDKTGTLRADAGKNDWYVFSGVTLFIALTPKGERCKRF
jgi:hypothetical protein